MAYFFIFFQVRDLIASDQLNVVSEEIVYKAIVTWIRHDASTRDRYLGKVRSDHYFQQ